LAKLPVVLPLKIILRGQEHWLTPVILATQEAEIRRIIVQGQSRKMFLRFPIHQLKLNMVEHTCHSSVWEA
jgi:hypothetical protein